MTPSNRRPPCLRSALAWLLLALSVVVATACSEAAPARSALVSAFPQASWTACSADNACEARWLSCRGWRAVSREHGAKAEAWYASENREYLAGADCDGRPPVQPPPAFCRAKQCTLE